MEEKIHVLFANSGGACGSAGTAVSAAVWGVLLFLIWAVQVIFWGFLQEYYPYADRIRGNSAAEHNGYRRLFCRKAVPSLASLAVPERSVLVQRDDSTLFQVIRWKQRLYFRYLCSGNQEDSEIQQHLIQNGADLDTGKKLGKKDFWLPVCQIQSVSYTKKSVANTKYAAFGVLHLQLKEDAAHKSSCNYVLSNVSAEDLEEMVSPVPFTAETAPCCDTPWSILKTLGRPRRWNLLLQVCLWLSAAWSTAFLRLPAAYQFSGDVLAALFRLDVSALLDTWQAVFVEKAGDGEWLGLFADSPRVQYGLFAPLVPLFFHGLHHSNLTAAGTRQFFLIFGLCSVVLFLLFFLSCRRRTGREIGCMIGFSLLFSCLFVGVGNRVYDFRLPWRNGRLW